MACIRNIGSSFYELPSMTLGQTLGLGPRIRLTFSRDLGIVDVFSGKNVGSLALCANPILTKANQREVPLSRTKNIITRLNFPVHPLTWEHGLERN